ncbi:MAG: HPr family phosphocarrier protein [Selenomonadaceae bacterium]|nr:HPr family phosphocarrier protein [Selenomonadaceae bacterium]
MKFKYKKIKNENKNYIVNDNKNNFNEEEDLAKYGAVVSFILVAKGVLGFRECAHIVRIAEETGCLIRLISGKKIGTTKSILSLVNLEIVPNKSLVLSIHGAKNEEAFREVVKVINGETDSNDA